VSPSTSAFSYASRNASVHAFSNKKTQADSVPIYRFAIDRNSNVFNSDELPALAQIGKDWKNLE
jgi:hypothetical protein